MKGLALIGFLVFYIPFKGQNIYPIKEHYDKLYPTILPTAPINYSNHKTNRDDLSWTLSSLLCMYETTGDKAYLIKIN